jgi:hypothetical protein
LIITFIFRCPSSVDDLTESSPKVCQPYLNARTLLTPHLEPYYDTYAAPYVEAARPYYETLDKNVITPATVYGKKYGAPRVAQAQAYGQAQWEKNINPQVSKLNAQVKKQYDASLAPHVDKVITAAAPYYQVARDNALQTYYASILPTYNAVQPHVRNAYGVAHRFTVDTGIPSAKWAWATGVIFLDRTLLPKLRILYGENVEPQLTRIGERLGRYRDGKRLRAAVDDIDRYETPAS